MSYMTPYYFSSSINQPLSIWMLSYDFAPKFGIALSGSNTKLTESFSGSAWQYSSSFAGAAVRYTTPSTAVYMVEATSIGATSTGSFQLYITAAETSSLATSNTGTPWRLLYSPNADRIFSVEWTFADSIPTCSVSVINPQTNVVVNNFEYHNTVMLDGLYNSQNDTICVWVSSSAGEFLNEYNGSGSALINSFPVTTSWVGGDPNNKSGQIVYNATSNQALLVPSTTTGPLSWSVYDFSSQSNVAFGLPTYRARYPIHASSTNYYYVFPFGDAANAAIKINAATYSSSVVTHMTGSGYGAAYISQVDRILYEDQIPSACSVFNPANDNLVAKIPGVLDIQFALFDTCKNCIVISDDAAGDASYTNGGGLCYVATSSYTPLNFIHMYGVYSIAYCNSTSTVWAANYYNNNVQAIITSVGTSSLPQPPYPPTASAPLSLPINLMVSSGSAILDWDISGSLTPDYYNVYRSTTGEAGPYSVITTSLNTHSVDHGVTAINTYWYKVEGVSLGGSTSSFSNQAAIDIIPCVKAPFEPVVFSEYLSYSSGSTYNNIYGKVLNFTTSVSRSISVWGRSPDFTTMLTLVDATGSVLRTNQNDGWSPSGDLNVYGANSALTYNLESGSYGIEISSVNNAVGRFTVVVSPGPKLETTWSVAQETAYVSYISSSGWILVGENGINAVFYNPATGQQKKITPNAGCQGALYSPIQDKAYLWVYYQTAGQYTASIDVYDNTGSYLHSNYFFRSPVNTFPNVDFSGYFCYDGKNDRLAFHAYNGFLTTQSFVVWDCATETIIAGPLNMKPFNPTFGDAWESCYSWIDNSYYVALTRTSPFYANPKMIKIDAATFVVTQSLTTNSILTSYISQSNLIIGRGGAGSNATGPAGGPVQFIDPVSDTVVYTSPDLPSQGQLFEGGSAGDKCANTYVMGIDPRSGYGDVNNRPCLAVIDRNTYLPMNYLKINDDVPSGFAPDGWYTYNLVSVDADSKVYMAQVEYDNNEARLYSIIPTRAFMPITSPFTSSASDTASCMTFKSEFPVTASGVTRATADYVCSSKLTGSGIIDTVVASDFEVNQFFSGMHNFNNYFLKSDGTYYTNYTSSYLHTYSGKNAVFCNSKFYMMSDETTEQSALYEPVSGSSILVFDQTGSLLTTIPLTYGGRDWATDGAYIYVYEIDTPTSGCYLETIDPTSDTIYSAATPLQIGYTFTPSFMFFNATASATASTNGTQFENQVPNFGRIIAFADNVGDTFIYYNDVYGGRVGTDPAPYDFQDTGSGDRIWAAGSNGTALYNYSTKLEMGQGSAYTKWCGSAGYCPITDHVYWGAVDLSDNAVIIETTKNLAFVNTHSVGHQIHSMVWNRKNRTMDLFSNETSTGRMYILDPVANTVVCNIITLNGGSYGGGYMGYSIDVNVTNGDIYIPQRIDGASSPATGSIKIYKV